MKAGDVMKFHLPSTWLFALIIVFVSLCISTVLVDYYRAQHQKDPLFTFQTEFMSDGGTKIMHGICYIVIHYNRTEEPADMPLGFDS